MRNMAAFAFGVFLAVSWGIANAETIPATYGKQTSPSWYKVGSTLTYIGATCAEAAAAKDADSTTHPWTCGAWSSGTGQTKSYHLVNPSGNNNGSYIYTYCPSPYTGWNGTTGLCETTTSSYSCPAGQSYTLSGTTCTRPDCPNGRNEDGTCKADDPCANTAGQTYSQGLYDMGVDPKGSVPTLACATNGCNVVFQGTSPAKVGLVNGYTHYYALGGYYYFPGATQASQGCTPGASNGVPTSTLTVPPDTCAANQGKAMMNGKTVCIDTTDGKPANTNGVPPDTTPKSGNTTTKNEAVNAATGEKVTTETTTAPDGSSSVKTTTCSADGASCSTSTSNTPGPGGGTGAFGGSGSGGGSGGAGSKDADGDGKADNPSGTTDDSTSDYCKENPSNPMCAEIKAGTGAGTSDLYTKGTRTATDVFNDFGNKVKGAGFYSSATNYFTGSVPAGSCSGLSQSFDFGGGHSVMIDLDSIFCGSTAAAIFQILGYGLMLAASWTAFRIAIL